MSDETAVEVSQTLPGADAPGEPALEAEQQTGETAAPEDSSQDDTADDPAAESKKHKGGFQRRIDELTRRVAEERREKERLLALVETTVKKPETTQQQQTQIAEPLRDQYETYEEYLEARATYRAEKAVETRIQAIERQRQEQAEQARLAEAQRAWSTRVAQATEKIPDFFEVVGNSSVQLTPTINQAIVESNVGPQVAYFLAQNPAEAARIAALSPARQAAEIGKLEDRVTKPAKASSAPEPIKPVGSRSQVSDLLSDKLPFDQWAKNFEKSFYGSRR